jgi:hypothetical protein
MTPTYGNLKGFGNNFIGFINNKRKFYLVCVVIGVISSSLIISYEIFRATT